MPTILEIIRDMKRTGQFDKSSPAVERILAKRIRASNPLREGTCEICGMKDFRLFPFNLKICLRCARNAQSKIGFVRILKMHYVMEGHNCDYCGARTFKWFLVNVEVCNKCVRKIKRVY